MLIEADVAGRLNGLGVGEVDAPHAVARVNGIPNEDANTSALLKRRGVVVQHIGGAERSPQVREIRWSGIQRSEWAVADLSEWKATRSAEGKPKSRALRPAPQAQMTSR